MHILSSLTLALGILASFSICAEPSWQMGPFERVEEANPIITPSKNSVFLCPIQNKQIHWESAHTFNPAAIARGEQVYLIYRAEDDYGTGIGKRTSRLGLAISQDGIHFERMAAPLLFPDWDNQTEFEFPGGCEDPRIVETEGGSYVLTYTQWNRQQAVLAIATSDDLIHWKKHGYAFGSNAERRWSKSGSIVCRLENDRLIATKIEGKYWMYWGEKVLHAAVSEDLISWEIVCDKTGKPAVVLEPREGKFDSLLVEAGPPAVLTQQGILLLYNGQNSPEKGDSKVPQRAYSAGQVLFDVSDPTKILQRCDHYFLTPEKSYEMTGQYKEGTVFIQGLVYFQKKWLLYYGTADSAIGVAASASSNQ